ncbi:hypothetical protein BSK56_26080 [Paenibacillus borealis]|uniref:Immunity protein 22 n=1 Tax=Paenibacillus borealis TaxID=160799 RepID=A0ABX3H427_PAEBO|nr:immunity 22 family protein [Paenibacillus borealis]OMD42361.1 hypothetical protein BSK56_26080 [Paenibacillus borealis]
MEKEGIVSLWIGFDENESTLQKYVTLIYSDEGEWLPSQFLLDFNIDMDDIDEPFIERVFHESSIGLLSDLIDGCSYDDVVIPGFEALRTNQLPSEINSAILIYNYEYSCDIKEVKRDGYSYVFIGSVPYE